MSPVTFVHEVREKGFRAAWHNFMGRRHLPLLGYIILTLAIGYTVTEVNDNQTDARADLRAAAVQVVVDGCVRDNDTRTTLTQILQSGEAAAYAGIKERGGSEGERQRAKDFYRDAYRDLKPIDCDEVAEDFRKQSLGE